MNEELCNKLCSTIEQCFSYGCETSIMDEARDIKLALVDIAKQLNRIANHLTGKDEYLEHS